jgi:ribosomal subunit interface protein
MLRISGRNLDIGEALRGQIEARVAGTIERYFEGRYNGHVTVGREGTGFRTDCALHLDSGVTLHATGVAHDPYQSFGEAAAHIEKRLRRYKRRLRAHAGNGAAPSVPVQYTVLEWPAEDEEEAHDFHPTVVAETTTNLKRLSVSDAVVELDLTGTPFVVFRHGGSGRVNVVYRRADGHIGWIDPPAGDASGRN